MCAGSAVDGSLTCTDCSGQGKAYGYASNGSRRLLNCKSCRGKDAIDCSLCRRGIATCNECDGSGRIQRWLEIEQWQRQTVNTHPQSAVHQLLWRIAPTDFEVARDTEIVAEIRQPRRITRDDAPNVPSLWFDLLAPTLEHGERIADQHLRIARFPTYAVRYRLGREVDHATFSGRSLAPPSTDNSLLAKRASRLRWLQLLLCAIAMLVMLFSLGRGTFYWSPATLVSLMFSIAAMVAIHGAVADASGRRRSVRVWLIAVALFTFIAVLSAIVALPRLAHAQKLLAATQLDAAEQELTALGDDAPPETWSELQLARIRQTSDIENARTILQKIATGTSAHAQGTTLVDALILRTIERHATAKHFADAAQLFPLITNRATPQVRTAAHSVLLPLAQGKIAEADWRRGADAIVTARSMGVEEAELTPMIDTIETRGIDAARKSARIANARDRLLRRLDAEQILVARDIASGEWGNAALMKLRHEMARDVAAVERAQRKRKNG